MNSRSLYAIAAVLALSFSAIPMAAAQVNPYVLPSISLSPTSGTLGTLVTVTGTGFSPGVSITLSSTSMEISGGAATTDTSGGFTAQFTVVAGQSGTVVGTGSDIASHPKDTAAATFTVEGVSTATIVTTTVGSNGAVTVNNTASTGVSVTIQGATGITGPITVSTSKATAPPASVTSTQVKGTVYVDVHVSLPPGTTVPAGATTTVCITDPTVASGWTLQYWTGTSWASATNITVSGSSVCGQIALSALTGTPVAAVPPAPVDYTVYYLGAFIVILLVVVVGALVLRRRGPRT